MRKLLLLSALSLAGTSLAADVSFSGSLEADYGTYFDKDFVVDNRANQDLGIDMNVGLDENVSATASFSTQSTYNSGDSVIASSQMRSRFASTEMGDSENRWGPVNFDGITLRWQFQKEAALVFGDLSYAMGGFDYYFWRNTANYAAVLEDQGLRGLGVEVGDGGRLYVGASDNNDKSGVVYASYPFAMINRTDNKLVITPSFDAIKGGGRDHRFTFGTEIAYSRSYTDVNYAVRGAWGTRPFHGDYVNTFLVEPSLAVGNFALAGTAYFAVLADGDSLASAQTAAPEERLVYAEPSYSLNKNFTLGLAGEWHDPDSEEDSDEWTTVSPTLYVYPTAGMEMVFWTGYSIYSSAPNLFSFGITGKVDF